LNTIQDLGDALAEEERTRRKGGEKLKAAERGGRPYPEEVPLVVHADCATEEQQRVGRDRCELEDA
jgi:hypothetical protein